MLKVTFRDRRKHYRVEQSPEFSHVVEKICITWGAILSNDGANILGTLARVVTKTGNKSMILATSGRLYTDLVIEEVNPNET